MRSGAVKHAPRHTDMEELGEQDLHCGAALALALGPTGMSGEQIAWREPVYVTSAEMKRCSDEEHSKLKAILAEPELTK